MISKAGIDFICSYEGFNAKPYFDIVGVPTIGYGSTHYSNNKRVSIDDAPITIDAAKELVKWYITTNIQPYIKTLNLKQNEYDAVCSFIYNLGISNFNSSSLKKSIINKGSKQDITANFLKWNKAGGKVVNGLTLRRQAEVKLYFL